MFLVENQRLATATSAIHRRGSGVTQVTSASGDRRVGVTQVRLASLSGEVAVAEGGAGRLEDATRATMSSAESVPRVGEDPS